MCHNNEMARSVLGLLPFFWGKRAISKIKSQELESLM